MLSVAEARELILASVKPTGVEWVALPQAPGRVLASDLRAERDQPPVAVSAMDGYAVRAADTSEPERRFRVVAEAVPGAPPAPALGPGEAVRIFTGGAIPPGADAVVVQEEATPDAEGVRFAAKVAPGTFVRPAGLDFARGWVGLAAGSLLDARALGLATALGAAWLPVRCRPRVGVLATGNELRWPGAPATASQIHSSNSVTLITMLAAWGAEPVNLGLCPDEGDALATRLGSAAGLDLLVTTGGASVGDHDLVQRVLGRAGMRVDFWKIAMRPGKPLIHGHVGDVPLLGFPGNPVSTAVCAILFLRAALQQMLGLPVHLRHRAAVLLNPLEPNDRREDYLRARYAEAGGRSGVRTAGRQDSSMFATFAHADVLLVRPPFDPARAPGESLPSIDIHNALDNLR